jgi:glutathione peroxidase
MSDSNLYSFSVKTLEGQSQSLNDYKGKVLLIVNVASKCGFTPQYTGLEALYKKHQSEGFVVLGFPCNQFGGQEPGNAEEIKKFCSLTYPVTFPMFSKIDVNGDRADPLYQHLKKEGKGILGTEAIKWNFTKFLVDRTGVVISRYSPQTSPESIDSDIQAALKPQN